MTTSRLDLVFSLDGANPVAWRACHPTCAQADLGQGTSVRFTGRDDPPQARLYLRGPGPAVDLQTVRFAADLSEARGARLVTFRSDFLAGGVRMIKAFEVSREGYEVRMTVEVGGVEAAGLTAGRRLELELGAGRGLLPPPAPGFSALLERVSRVVITSGGIRAVADPASAPTPLSAGDWVGYRGRFWALFLRPGDAGVLEPRSGESAIAVTADAAGRASWRYTFYSGPLESRALTRADPDLERLLLSGLWSWLRALSLGLLWVLDGLTILVRQPGLAIIALAVSVKLLLLPLAFVAERWQEQVNATQARLQPGLDAIKAAHRGEERARRTLALYQKEGVHHLYTLKSLLGVLIQLPVFIAVFDMLAEDFHLSRVGFLWIRDLARPDELWRLPVCLPFFGCYLNLLPFLMSGVSLATLLRFGSSTLSPSLVRKQRRNLAGMTALFFLLFYTFPAAMVLYWTSTNAFQLAAQEMRRRLAGRRGADALGLRRRL